MHLTLISLALLSLVGVSPANAKDGSPLVFDTHVGSQFMVKLPGNPKAGYRWRLNREESSGLNLIDVDIVGWLISPESRSMFYRQNSKLNISIVAKAAGVANLTFEYYRFGNFRSKPQKRAVKIMISPEELASR